MGTTTGVCTECWLLVSRYSAMREKMRHVVTETRCTSPADAQATVRQSRTSGNLDWNPGPKDIICKLETAVSMKTKSMEFRNPVTIVSI